MQSERKGCTRCVSACEQKTIAKVIINLSLGYTFQTQKAGKLVIYCVLKMLLNIISYTSIFLDGVWGNHFSSFAIYWGVYRVVKLGMFVG